MPGVIAAESQTGWMDMDKRMIDRTATLCLGAIIATRRLDGHGIKRIDRRIHLSIRISKVIPIYSSGEALTRHSTAPRRGVQ
ncbi:hypothetical protein AVEN_201770-1 [Araneus ventricosus]|uniref:Uncharacterized protein n=1 Tax=Araneus ventricosus TaxID=182803 RepID=A0A4Y2KXK9_ARAVE|nr:hypothetical protein AVEN_201770-1 [Araneus ventricosus]